MKSLERITLEVGSFAVNCTLLVTEGKAWIVDPGAEAERILACLRERALVPAGILLTHAHFDHIGAVPGLLAAYPDLTVYVTAADAAIITHPFNAYPPDYPAIPRPPRTAEPSDCPIDGLEAIATPGHTPGGVCLYFAREKLLLSGDTLFAGSVGRTDFPGGDMKTLLDSLRKLTVLPDDTAVIPGHGPATTIGDEKRTNPFLR